MAAVFAAMSQVVLAGLRFSRLQDDNPANREETYDAATTASYVTRTPRLEVEGRSVI